MAFPINGESTRLMRWDGRVPCLDAYLFGAAVLVFILTACSTDPTGSAARLNDIRVSPIARDGISGADAISDIAAYLAEVRAIPADPVMTGNPLVDDQGLYYAEKFKVARELVIAYQTRLEEFKDVASFIGANYAKSPGEFAQAVRELDRNNTSASIGRRIERFYAAEKEIFDLNSKLSRTNFQSATRFFDPIGVVSSIIDGVVTIVPGDGRYQSCSDRQGCITRSIAEHRIIFGNAMDRITQHRQAAINGSAYISGIEAKLSAVLSLGSIVIVQSGTRIDVETLTQRETFDYAFDVRKETIRADADAVWNAARKVLLGYGHSFALEDGREHILVTDVVYQKAVSGLFNSGRYYAKYYVVVSQEQSHDANQTSQLGFKRFLYRSDVREIITPFSGVIEFSPRYDETERRRGEQNFIDGVRQSLGIR